MTINPAVRFTTNPFTRRAHGGRPAQLLPHDYYVAIGRLGGRPRGSSSGRSRPARSRTDVAAAVNVSGARATPRKTLAERRQVVAARRQRERAHRLQMRVAAWRSERGSNEP